jgi:AcrR family transcriptional regulator
MTIAEQQDFQKRFKYHHGNLRDSLVSAALDILQTQGMDALSLRALAKATGVTQAAPYSHFRDKDELLAAIAETGFQSLAFFMAESATGLKAPRERIESLVSSYVRFADENKALFRLMFGRELADMKKFPTLAMTAGKSYALLSAALSGRTSTDVDTRFLTVAVWSLCQGLADLIVNGKLDPVQFGMDSADDFVKKTIGIFSQHLD